MYRITIFDPSEQNWRPIYVDDRAPAGIRYDNALLGAASSNTKMISLVVKAYAKLYGNIEAINGGSGAHVLSIFLGAVIQAPLNPVTPEKLKQTFLYKSNEYSKKDGGGHHDDVKWWEHEFYTNRTHWTETWGHEVSFDGNHPLLKHPYNLISGHAYGLIATELFNFTECSPDLKDPDHEEGKGRSARNKVPINISPFRRTSVKFISVGGSAPRPSHLTDVHLHGRVS